jgi:lysozyme
MTPYLASDIGGQEGDKLRAYLDGGGVPTIGKGHTGPEVHLGLVWTQAQVDNALAADIHKAAVALDGHLPWWRTLNDARQDVMVILTFNLGMTGFLDFHHTLGAVEAHAYAEAAADLLLSQPWHGQVGDHRANLLATQLRSGLRAATAHAAA